MRNIDLINLVDKDLLIVNALSVILVLTIFLLPDSPLRIILGIPFVLFFPGYALLGALFPGRTSIGQLERFALSMGLSLAIVPLIGLTLNYTPWGIRIYPIVASLFILTLLLSIVTSYRRKNLPVAQKTCFPFPKLPKWSLMPKTEKIFAVGFLIAIIVILASTVYMASAPKTGAQFTEFYILSSNGTLSNYPGNLTLGETCAVMLGVKNHEYENLTYRITVKFNDQTIDTLEGIQLNHEDTWNQTFSFTPKIAGEKLKLEFQLYKQDITDPYRSLQLWINVKPPQ